MIDKGEDPWGPHQGVPKVPKWPQNCIPRGQFWPFLDLWDNPNPNPNPNPKSLIFLFCSLQLTLATNFHYFTLILCGEVVENDRR